MSKLAAVPTFSSVADLGNAITRAEQVEAERLADLPRQAVARLERARADFVKGTVRPDAPGMLYYPALRDLAASYDLEEANIAAVARRDSWVDQRAKEMATSLVTPFACAVDANPAIVRRGEMVVKAMEEFDDVVFSLSKRAMVIAQRAVEQLEAEAEDDPVRVIRGLRSVSQTMESLHRTAKQAYDPAAIRPDNSVHVSVTNVPASEDVVLRVASIYARMETEAKNRGIEVPDETIMDAELVEEDAS